MIYGSDIVDYFHIRQMQNIETIWKRISPKASDLHEAINDGIDNLGSDIEDIKDFVNLMHDLLYSIICYRSNGMV